MANVSRLGRGCGRRHLKSPRLHRADSIDRLRTASAAHSAAMDGRMQPSLTRPRQRSVQEKDPTECSALLRKQSIAFVGNAIVTIAVKSAPAALVPVVTPMGSDSGGPSTAEKCAAWPLVDASAIAWTIGLAPSTVQLTKIDASKPLASQLIGVQIAGVG